MCIFCLKEEYITKEHIIPESLGGKLICNFVCKFCNSKIGSIIEAEARKDPSIRIAVENLQNTIPTLHNKIREKQKFKLKDSSESLIGVLNKGEYRIIKNGSNIVEASKTTRKIKRMLSKSGCTPSEIEESLKKFDNAPINEKVQIGCGLEIMKRNINSIELDLSHSQLINSVLPLKIAFEFIAICIGTEIYNTEAAIQNIRDIIIKNLKIDDVCSIERLTGSYEPFHGIYFEGNHPHACIQIRLFGWLVFRVHFLKLVIQSNRFAYTHRLDYNEEYINCDK
jgi:hypothetical protein